MSVNEIKRVLLHKKMVGLFLAVFMINLFLFYHEQENRYSSYNEKYDVTVKELFTDYNAMIEPYRGKTIAECQEILGTWLEQQGEELNAYESRLEQKLEKSLIHCEEYQEYLEEIQSRAKQMNSVSIFQTEDSFSSKNIKKTAQDFEGLDDVTLELGIDDSVTGITSYALADYFVLVLIIAVAYQFIAERKNGLWEIVHQTRNGRARLALKRILVLLVASVISCILIYGGTIILSFYLYGGWQDLGRGIQSIVDFKVCNLPISVGTFLVQYLGIKCITVFLTGAVVWLILSAISNLSIGLLILGVFLGIEYSLFYFLPVQSAANIFKYINFFSYVDLDQLFISYLNIDLFGTAVGARKMILLLLPLLLVISLCAAVFVNASKKPKEKNQLLDRLFRILQLVSNQIVRRLNLCLLEVYKLLFVKKGIIILVLFGLYQYSSITGGEVFYGEEELYLNNYIEKMEGPLDENSLAVMNQISSELEEKQTQLNLLEQDFQQGKITLEDYEASCKYNDYDSLEKKLTAYETLEERVNRLQNTSQKLGVTLSLFSEYGYERLMDSDSLTEHNKVALITVFIIIILFSCGVVYEKQNTTFYLLRSMKMGRKRLYHKKLLAGGLVLIAVFVMASGAELLNVYHLYGMKYLSEPVQSLTCLNDFPVVISIGTYLGIVYLLRFLMLLSVMYIVYFVSGLVKKEEYAILINILLVLAPSVLYYIGVDFMKYIAVIIPVTAYSGLGSLQDSAAGIVQMLLLLTIGILAREKGKRNWSIG